MRRSWYSWHYHLTWPLVTGGPFKRTCPSNANKGWRKQRETEIKKVLISFHVLISNSCFSPASFFVILSIFFFPFSHIFWEIIFIFFLRLHSFLSFYFNPRHYCCYYIVIYISSVSPYHCCWCPVNELRFMFIHSI